MRRHLTAAIAALLLLPVGTGGAAAADPSPVAADRSPWILDTDMGVDDAIAGTLLLRDPSVEVVAITTNASGLGSCAKATREIALLVETVGGAPGIPIGCSRAFPLQGYAAFPTGWRVTAARVIAEAVQEVAGTTIADEPDWVQPDGARVLAEALAASPRPVSILALGPLTTIAMVLDASPALIAKVDRIVMMGGAFDVPGNVRVPGFTDAVGNERGEWNLFVDPIAAQVVLATGIPVTFVPLDATNTMPLRERFLDGLAAASADGSRAAAFILAMLGRIDFASYGEYYHWDPFAALVAAGRIACRMEQRTVRVLAETGGEILDYGIDPDAFPWTDWKGEPRRNIEAATAGALEDDPGGTPVGVCLSASVEDFEAVALDLLRQD